MPETRKIHARSQSCGYPQPAADPADDQGHAQRSSGGASVLVCSSSDADDPYLCAVRSAWTGVVKVYPDAYKLLAAVAGPTKPLPVGVIVNASVIDNYDWQVFWLLAQKRPQLQVLFYRWPGRMQLSQLPGGPFQQAGDPTEAEQWLGQLGEQDAVEESIAGGESEEILKASGSAPGTWPAPPPVESPSQAAKAEDRQAAISDTGIDERADQDTIVKQRPQVRPGKPSGDAVEPAEVLTPEELQALLGGGAGNGSKIPDRQEDAK